MKKILLSMLFLAFTIQSKAVDYYSISTTLWSNTDGGADCSCSPGNLTTGDNVYVRHAISSAVMTLSGTPTVTIYSGGTWTLTGGNMTIDAGTWTINTGGHLKISAGNLTSGGFTTFAVNGTMGVTGDITNTGAITGTGSISYTGSLNNTGTIQPTTTLPVELISFYVEKKEGNAVLNWTTASELNSSYFKVLRSSNGTDFKVIETVNAAGNSTKVINYSFVDLSPLSGNNYYQLEEVDVDGKTQKSNVVVYESVEQSSFEVALFPNPTHENLSLDFISPCEDVYQISLYDIGGGKLLFTENVSVSKGENTKLIYIGNYADGRILFTISDSKNKIHNTQVVLKK